MARYVVGDPVVLTNTFTVSDVNTDPDTVQLDVTDPSGNTDTYTYAAAQITKTATGVYTKTVTVDEAGTWQFVWTGTGAAADVADGTFDVFTAADRNLYAPLDAVKTMLGITDTTDDVQLQIAANAATQTINRYCGRRFHLDTTATARTFYPVDRVLLRVDDIATTTGLVVKTDTSDDGTFDTTWTTADYQLEPLNGVSDGHESWPYTRLRAVESLYWPVTSRRAPVQVTAQWGWTDIPHSIVEAALILSSEYFKLKDAPFGVAGFGEFGAVRVRDIPQVSRLLDPYVKNRVMVA